MVNIFTHSLFLGSYVFCFSANGSAISCCTADGSNELPHQFRHFACMPIVIPPKDSFYSVFKQGCMSFVRSILAPRHDCTLGYAQQVINTSVKVIN